MAITHVRHVDIFIAIYRDFQRIGQRFVKGKRADLFATALRVLEMMRKEQIGMLTTAGLAEKDITEDMLGFPMLWEHFKERALAHYCKRSFEGIIEQVIEAGFVHRFYVECHRRKERAGTREELALVRDADGILPLYRTIEEAQQNRLSGGEIINYFFFNAEAVNRLIEEIYRLAAPSPQPPTPHGHGHDQKKNGSAQRRPSPNHVADSRTEQPPTTDVSIAREGNPITSEQSVNIIHQPSQIYEGIDAMSQNDPTATRIRESISTQGSQNCGGEAGNSAREGSQNGAGKARKTASNSNKIIKNTEEPVKETIISAPGAIELLSQFDFSQDPSHQAILQLSRLFYAPLPAKYKTEEDKEAAYARIDAAAKAIAAMPLVWDLGLRQIAATMAYQADESSPCTWRAYCRKQFNNPGLVPRLWNLESETVLRKMHREMEACGWWPAYLPRATGLVETPPDIDLLELAGIDEYERVGMEAETCQSVEAWLADMLEPHGYEVGHRRVGASGERGYAIEVWYGHEDGTRRALRFYGAEQWDLIVEADGVAPIGSLEFVRHLREAVRRNQVA